MPEVEDSSCFLEDLRPAIFAKFVDGPKDDYSHTIQTLDRLCSLLQASSEQSFPSTQLPWLTEAMSTLSLCLAAAFCEAFKHISS
jgi:hypothetical protein